MKIDTMLLRKDLKRICKKHGLKFLAFANLEDRKKDVFIGGFVSPNNKINKHELIDLLSATGRLYQFMRENACNSILERSNITK
jgi:hypothetical protein